MKLGQQFRIHRNSIQTLELIQSNPQPEARETFFHSPILFDTAPLFGKICLPVRSLVDSKEGVRLSCLKRFPKIPIVKLASFSQNSPHFTLLYFTSFGSTRLGSAWHQFRNQKRPTTPPTSMKGNVSQL